MKEADFCLEIKHSLEQIPGVYYHKIPDQPRFAGERVRFAAPRPYDCYVVYRGIHHAFEVKLHKTSDAFPLSKITDHQIENLLKVKDAGGIAGIIIGLRGVWGQYARYFPAIDWVYLAEGVRVFDGRQSVLVRDIFEKGLSIHWLGNGLWDFGRFLEFFHTLKKNT